MHRNTAAAAALAAVLAAGCAGITGDAPGRRTPGASQEPNPQLADTRWTLQSLGGIEVPRTPNITLDLGPDGLAGGSDGCNRFQTAYTTNGASIAISLKMGGTMMACPDPIEARANAYRETLRRAAGFALSDGRLSLKNSTGRVLAVFVPSNTALAGTRWEVVAYNNGRGGVVSLLAGTRMSVDFEKDGQVTGSAGCNRYFAPYQQSGQRLAVGMAATTRKFCAEPQGLMQQETQFLDVLRASATLAIDGDRLELRKADGALAVMLNRQSGQ